MLGLIIYVYEWDLLLIFDNWIFLGFYCFSGIKYVIEYLCLVGIYNNKIGVNSEFDCFFCIGKFYGFFLLVFGYYYNKKLVCILLIF